MTNSRITITPMTDQENEVVIEDLTTGKLQVKVLTDTDLARVRNLIDDLGK